MSFVRLFASSVAASALAMTLASEAAAQPKPAAKAKPVTTTATPEYVEQTTEGDQVVKFTGDELVGPAGGIFGEVIRPLPGTVRIGLIRPRLNFVPELLKSVENL